MSMLAFSRVLDAYGRQDLESVLKHEIEALSVADLPLVHALQGCNEFADDKIQATLLKISDEANRLRVKAGIFFLGVLTGCSCADDPTPVEPQNLYCELMFDIDKASAAVTVTLVD
jgi:hypothetical protein